MNYPIRLEPDDNGTILVSFPDFPEAHTFGENRADAIVRARDALATVLEAYIKDRRAIPAASVRPRQRRVAVPALIEAKLRVYEAMRAANVGKAELARRLRWHMPQIDRLLNVRHGSKLDQLEAAVAALGKRLTIGIDDLQVPSTHRRRRESRRPRRQRDGQSKTILQVRHRK